MRRLILSDIHENLGARMVDFAGHYMPIQYDGVKSEHKNVRESVGVFDVSHMGEIFVHGDKSEEFLQYITSNDVMNLSVGKVQYTCFPNTNGGIVDDLLLYKIKEKEYLLVVNASNIEKDLKWMKSYNRYGVSIDNRSDEYCLFAVQGPRSIELLQELTDYNLLEIKYYNYKFVNISGIDDVLLSRTGYTGELGFELYIKNKYAIKLWESLFSTSIKLHPIGLSARDTLRLEKGFCLYGNDINDSTSPIEAGLGWITKFSKEFINSSNLLEQKKQGTRKRLVGIELLEKGIARKDYYVLNENGDKIGSVTSGTMSPTLNKAIALGYVVSEYTSLGSEIFIQVRNKKIKSKVVSLPFVR